MKVFWVCDTGCCRVVGRNERRVDSEAVSEGVRDSNQILVTGLNAVSHKPQAPGTHPSRRPISV